MKVGVLLSLVFLIDGAFSASCPSIPDISIYLSEAKEKTTQACDEVLDYYISEVHSDENAQEFAKGMQQASDPNYSEVKKNYARARNIIMQATGTTSQNFSQGYWYGGFSDAPLSCFNKIISTIRIEEEKSKVEYESLQSRLLELFEFYLSRRKRSKKTGAPAPQASSSNITSTTIKPSSSTPAPTTSTVKTTCKQTRSKVQQTGTKTKPTGTKTKKTTSKYSTASKTKNPKRNVGSTAPAQNQVTTKPKVGEISPTPRSTLPPFTSSSPSRAPPSSAAKLEDSTLSPATTLTPPKSSSGPSSSLSSSSSTLKSSSAASGITASNSGASSSSGPSTGSGSNSGLSSSSGSNSPQSSTTSIIITTTPTSNSTSTTLKCPTMPNIQAFLDVMIDRASDICEKSKYFYVDYVNRDEVLSFPNALKQKIYHHELALNVSFNNTFNAVRSATGVSTNDFRIAYDNGGFCNWPLSCYNNLILLLKIEHMKLMGKIEGVRQQLMFLFSHYKKNK